MTSLTIDAGDGSFSAYVATPTAGTGPAVVVIQEIFGVNQVMRDITDDLAAKGFIAICPDLFWRIEPGIDITDKTEAEWQRAFQLFGAFDVDLGVKDLAATIAAARTYPGSTGKVGAVGYCLGGKLAYLTATRTSVDAAVGFYGVMIDQLLGEAAAITKPLLLHIAGKDGFVPPEAQAKMHGVLDTHPLVTLLDYPEDDHAFARVGGKHYNAASADRANAASLEFLRQHLA